MSITFEHLGYTYSEGTPFEFAALKDINLKIREGKITALVGHTGCGKSTLVQHLNALLLPNEGKLEIMDRTIVAGEKAKHLKSLRKDVGLVFQFPEYQLFEETVLKDVAFGPKNFGATDQDALKRAAAALRMVGITDDMFEKSPLELSGGQKRRVAIAGILAMDPKVLVLDEPTAGLDPAGTASMMRLFYDLNKKYNKTVIMVTHDMENVFSYCDDVIVMKEGTIMLHTDAREFFKDARGCEELHILPPALIRLKDMLKEKGFDVPEEVRNINELAESVAKQVKKHG